ncbi:uncharacterized protein LOC135697040 [Ochlerotatus camptorhynchus]|uniref:uncharacterized protein LOC135697040 n=1 Tax=Ochlerotatus camptorhynchus TaxID=644619 RepID=UPI0031E31C35
MLRRRRRLVAIFKYMNTLVQKPKPLVTPKIWKRDEILTFLDIFESTFHASVSHPFDSETDMWKCISDKLLEQGITASAQHCQNKWNFLYKTYVNNQNRQGAFYAKIKQIVEFSKELSDQQDEPEPVTSEEQQDVETEIIEDLETDTFMKQEDFSHIEGQVAEVSVEESFEEHEHLDEIATSNIPDRHPDVQCDNRNNLIEVEVSAKKRKLSSNVDNFEQNTSVKMDENVDTKDILLTILSRIDAIHKEQIDQGRRLEIIERRQNENRQILLNVKEHLELK